MDIAPLRASIAFSGDTDDSDDSDMAYEGATVQGDYSGYVPPEVSVTSNNNPTAKLRKTSATRPPQKVSIN